MGRRGSYRRAEEIFEETTRLLANPLARPEQWEELQGWTLHPDPRRGERHQHPDTAGPAPGTPPGVDAVAGHVAALDPAARGRG
ncbi:hypothetical protein AB0F71_31220 [Kitasatospora sp. NPDC028055]|uniref:hypothetical protein n=1 Tax=Kitasatospora sp. NPDC028055 TaxID=3155653 RepID=UPI00340BEF13